MTRETCPKSKMPSETPLSAQRQLTTPDPCAPTTDSGGLAEASRGAGGDSPSPGPQCQRPPRLVLGRHPRRLRTGDPENLLDGLEGQQRLGQLPQEGLQDHSREVDVAIVVKVHRLP